MRHIKPTNVIIGDLIVAWCRILGTLFLGS